jgi:hypothetical protein
LAFDAMYSWSIEKRALRNAREQVKKKKKVVKNFGKKNRSPTPTHYMPLDM